jgi:hypothetical protein
MRRQDRQAQLRRQVKHLLWSGCPMMRNPVLTTALDEVTCPWCRGYIRTQLDMRTFEMLCRRAGLGPRGQKLSDAPEPDLKKRL